MAAPRIAVLGLGILGDVVARRAVQAGVPVIAWDRSPSHRVSIAAHVETASTPAEAVRRRDGARDRACREPADIAFVDAPVSGSKYVAEAGQLVVFASGDRELAAGAVQPFFDSIAREVHWLGEAGQGTRIGLLFSAWIAMLIANIAEVTRLAQALDIERRRFVELVSNGALVPPWALAKFQKIVEHRTGEVEVPLRLAHKNLLLALAAAGDERARLPVLEDIASTWAGVVREHGDSDISAVYLRE
jgi:3-hydroxyisobutyrate dehydrogenase